MSIPVKEMLGAQGIVSTTMTEYTTKDGKKVTKNDIEVTPSKSGALAGAAAGAAIGSAVPGVGTAVGGTIGGLIGLIFGPAD